MLQQQQQQLDAADTALAVSGVDMSKNTCGCRRGDLLVQLLMSLEAAPPGRDRSSLSLSAHQHQQPLPHPWHACANYTSKSVQQVHVHVRGVFITTRCVSADCAV